MPEQSGEPRKAPLWRKCGARPCDQVAISGKTAFSFFPGSIWNAYALTVLAAAIAMCVRVALASRIGDRLLLVVLVIPMLFSAYSGGLGPGLLSTLMVALSAAYVPVPPLHGHWFARSVDLTQSMTLIVVGVLVSGVIEALHRGRRAVDEKNESLMAEIQVRRRAEQALEELSQQTGKRERMLAMTLSSLEDFAYAFDQDARFLFANQPLLDLWGISLESAVGKSFFDLGYPDDLARKHQLEVREVFQTRQSVTDETSYTSPAGLKGQYEYIFSPAFAADGTVDFVVGSTRDITARKQSEDALRRSEERLSLITDLVPHGIFAKDGAGRHIFANPALAEMAGLSVEGMLGKTDFDLVADKAQAEAYRADDLAVMQSGKRKFIPEEPRTDLAGRTRFLQTIKIPFTVPETGERGVLGVCMDITEQKQAETSLQESEERFRSMFRAAATGIAISTPDGRFLQANAAYCRMLGYTEDELRTRDFASLTHPDDINHNLNLRDELLAGQRENFVMEKRYLKKERGVLWTRASVSAVRSAGGEIRMLIVVAEDITERKLAEEALLRQQTELQALFDLMPAMVCFKDTNNVFLRVNQRMAEAAGRTIAEIEGKPAADVFPRDAAKYYADDLEVIRSRTAKMGIAEKLQSPDGEDLWVQTDKVPVCDKEGKVTGIVVMVQDITQRRLNEQELQAQMVRLNLLNDITRSIGERQDLHSMLQVVISSLEENLPVDFCCVCVYDQPANALQVVHVGTKSAATAAELAMPEKATVRIDENGLSRCVGGQLVYEADISQVPFPFPQRLARGGLRSLVIAPLLVESKVFGVLVVAQREPRRFVSGECEFLKQLSEHLALAWHQSQLYGALQKAYDDLRRTQQAVMQQERLRALGQMASGIAHDINNAMTPISLYTESLLESEPNLSLRGRGYLEIIARAIEDVSQTVARMGEFYRQREPQLTLKPVHLNQLVQQVVDLTRARWSDMPQQRGIVIEMKTDVPPGLPAVMGVESEIREALTNLVFNAVDAMPGGGTLTLRTKVQETAPAMPGSPGLRHVHLEAADTGVGMDEETRQRCLEPFFTTKGERGTGLGLAMVYGIARRHGADLEIESVVGNGTIVRLCFLVPATPVIDTDPPAPAPARATPSSLRILVVDDEQPITKLLRNTLETDGHKIVTANGGQAGIEAFLDAETRNEPFDLVITDLGMPYVDGHKVAGTVKAASPATPVILLTGWGQRLEAEGDTPAHVDRVLNKPPKLRELRAAVAELTA